MTDIDNGLIQAAPRFVDSMAEKPLFRENWPDRLRRWALGSAYALKPKRIGLLPRITAMTVGQVLSPGKLPEKPVYHSWRGLVGVSDDLSVESLLHNYGRGLFPFCHVGPMKWWCPEERAVMDPAEIHVGKNLRRMLKQHKFEITFDTDFAGVMEACARPREGKVPLTWITPKIMRAFYDAHLAGHAHSLEVWNLDGKLVGGLYGIAVGKAFFGESQFYREEHMSKVAMVALHRHLAAWGFHLRDAKWMTPHLTSYGFYAVPRDQFLAMLAKRAAEPGLIGRWQADQEIDLASGQPVQTPEAQKPVSKQATGNG
jgi:leucyl/phenylalanyl-tRNA--protein transferase